jgi:hypothetical protein
MNSMTTFWAENTWRCSDCLAMVSGPRKTEDGICSSCRDYSPIPYRAPNGDHGKREFLAKSGYWGPHEQRLAKAESDLRFYFTEAESAMGLHAISMANDVAPPLARQDSYTNGDGVQVSGGAFHCHPTRVIVVKGMTLGQLVAARRCRRVYRTLAGLSKRHQRVLQRRYEVVYFPELDSLVGEWSGVVDLLAPEFTERCHPRDGKRPSTLECETQMERAKDAWHRALLAFVKEA